MNDFFDKLAKVAPLQKAAVILLLSGVLVLVYWQFFYSDLQSKLQSLDAEYGRLDTERKDYEKRKAEYLKYREDVRRLREEQKELLKVLPKSSEIPTFLDSLHTQATLSGLEIVSFVRKDEQPKDVYVRIPVEMEVRGNYHQVAKFAKIVGELKRIVNIESVELSDPKGKDGIIQLKAKFTAATFRFQDKPAPGAPAKKKATP
jgi:type IV pilus assembly protein PilO